MRTTVTRAAAADWGGATRNLKAQPRLQYCAEPGGGLVAVALSFGLGRSLAPPAVRVVRLQRAAVLGARSLSPCLLHFASTSLFFHPSLPCPSPAFRLF